MQEDESQYNDYEYAVNDLNPDIYTIIPRITGITTFSLADSGACLGFNTTYWDG
jgi:hypothetical protein